MGVFGHKGSIFDHLGIVFRRKFIKNRAAIVKLRANFRSNFVPRIANVITNNVPIIFHVTFSKQAKGHAEVAREQSYSSVTTLSWKIELLKHVLYIKILRRSITTACVSVD